MSKTAVIVGARGQDGRLLTELLRSKAYRLVCVDQGQLTVEGLPGRDPVDITRRGDVRDLVQHVQPDEVYHLAAVHHSSQETARPDLELFRASYEVNFFSLLHFLDAVRLHSPRTRLFYAASSLVFGEPPTEVQTEQTPFSPGSVYAMTKVDGLLACRQYRAAHGLFASVGILYNHESKYRADKFLTRKVVRAAVAIKRGATEPLALGDLEASVDWGYAPDYVEAMHAMLQAPQPDDFIVATGARHTVREFVELAFREVGLDWRKHVVAAGQAMGRQAWTRIGDAGKLIRATGWRPRTGFEDMIRLLVRDELASAPSA